MFSLRVQLPPKKVFQCGFRGLKPFSGGVLGTLRLCKSHCSISSRTLQPLPTAPTSSMSITPQAALKLRVLSGERLGGLDPEHGVFFFVFDVQLLVFAFSSMVYFIDLWSLMGSTFKIILDHAPSKRCVTWGFNKYGFSQFRGVAFVPQGEFGRSCGGFRMLWTPSYVCICFYINPNLPNLPHLSHLSHYTFSALPPPFVPLQTALPPPRACRAPSTNSSRVSSPLPQWMPSLEQNTFWGLPSMYCTPRFNDFV